MTPVSSNYDANHMHMHSDQINFLVSFLHYIIKNLF